MSAGTPAPPPPITPATGSRGRAHALAGSARRLANEAGVALPAGLALFELGGGSDTYSEDRAAPGPGGARTGDDAAAALVAALERSLTVGERRRGAHYTPPVVADRVVELGLAGSPSTPVIGDPACGGGAMLLAAARRLAGRGIDRRTIVRDLLWGADIDPLAVAVTQAALTLWSGGTAPAPGHVAVVDSLHDSAAWGPPGGFDVVVGNPPFQGQLARATARTGVEVRRLRERWRVEISPYVDTAALFLLVAVDLVRSGGRVAMVQPQSTAAARDAGAVRTALAARAHLHSLWAPAERLFRAGVHVCVPVLVRVDGAAPPASAAWSELLADQRGCPAVQVAGPVTVADVADVVAGFRDEYYGLVPHVSEDDGPVDVAAAAPEDRRHRLVTSGLVDVGCIRWGERPVRFAKAAWEQPIVDVAAVRTSSARLDGWLDRVLLPKVVVASQTRVVEAASDRSGLVVPVIPAISVVPADPADVDRLAAALCSPPVSAWVARRAAGNALSPGAVRIAAPLLAQVPLPVDGPAWQTAAEALASGDLDAFATTATAMYGLAGVDAADVITWWHAHRPTR